jgi:hypothetical protein
VIVCKPRILENLEKNPAADRVLLNMVSFADSTVKTLSMNGSSTP